MQANEKWPLQLAVHYHNVYHNVHGQDLSSGTKLVSFHSKTDMIFNLFIINGKLVNKNAILILISLVRSQNDNSDI